MKLSVTEQDIKNMIKAAKTDAALADALNKAFTVYMLSNTPEIEDDSSEREDMLRRIRNEVISRPMVFGKKDWHE